MATTKWYESHDNMTRLGAELVDELCYDASALQRYYEKPWEWDKEWQWLQTHESLDGFDDE